MTARESTAVLRDRLIARGINASFEQANILRRAEKTLSRWSELECGDSDNFKSWAIERDEETGLAYMAVYPHDGKSRRYRIPDREKGALKRVQAVCAALGAFWYHQTDPRGCALYVSTEKLTDQDYSRGVACCE